MAIIEFLGQYGGWSWIGFGLVLLAGELVIPGVFLVWLGGAAILTGVTAFQTGIGWPLQWAVFGVLSVALAAGWTAFSRRRHAKNPPSDNPLLNKRTARFIGRQAVLVEPISDGYGRIRMDDTLWRVAGPELGEGMIVRITGARGAVLDVEPIDGDAQG